MDILVPISMKNAAKCDTQCELQNSASHQIFERKWRWRPTASMPVSVCEESHSTMRLTGEALPPLPSLVKLGIAERLCAALSEVVTSSSESDLVSGITGGAHYKAYSTTTKLFTSSPPHLRSDKITR